MRYLGSSADQKDAIAREYIDGKLAPVETSPATAAHTAGSLLIYSGTLYKATADIAIGDTLTAGTNIAATDLDEQVSTLKSAINDKQNAPTVVTQTAPSAITLADNTEYYLSDVASLTLTYPSAAHWACYITLTTAASGTVTITLPTSDYIGTVPTFGNSEEWEISIRDGVVVAGKSEAAT